MSIEKRILDFICNGPIAQPVLFYLEYFDDVLPALAELIDSFCITLILNGEDIIQQYSTADITAEQTEDQKERAWEEFLKVAPSNTSQAIFTYKNMCGECSEDTVEHGEHAYFIPIMLKNSCVGIIYMGFDEKVTTVQRNAADMIITRMIEKINSSLLKAQISKATDVMNKRFHTISTLQSIIRSISSGEGETDILRRVLEFSIKEAGASGGSIQLIDYIKNSLYIKVASGLDERTIKNFSLPVGEGVVGNVAKSGKPVILTSNIDVIRSSRNPDYFKLIPDGNIYPNKDRKNVKSVISVPMKIKDVIIGVLNITSDVIEFTETECEMILSYASLAAQVFENKRLYRQEEKRARELEKINLTAKSLTSIKEQREILKCIFSSLEELIPFKVGVCLIESDEQIKVKINANERVSDKCVEMIKNFCLFSYGEMLGISRFTKNIKCVQIREFREEHCEIDYEVRSNIVVPIMINGCVKGLIAILHDRADAFLPDDMRTLSTIASYASISLENYAILKNMEEKVRELSILFEISKSISSTLDLDQVLNLIIKITAKLLKSKVSILRLFDEDSKEFVLRAHHGIHENNLSKGILISDETVMKEVVETGQTVSIYDVKQDTRTQYVFEKYNLCSMISVPMIVRGNTIGVINCYTDTRKIFKENEKNLLFTLASHASVSIENAKLYGNMEKNYFSTIAALAAAIDTKDHYTHGHSKMVMEYAASIAEDLGLSKHEIDNIKFAGLLHDIGKIGISESILLKTSSLTDREFEIIKEHPKMGAFIMEQVDFLKDIAPITFHHHEKYDGTGYPDKLEGDDIPIGSRILCVADSFDAMTSTRSYRKAMSIEDAVDEITKNSGTQFDPKVVDSFLKIIEHRIKLQKMNILKKDMINSKNSIQEDA